MNNAAHLHLLVNHFPIFLPLFGLIILIVGIVFKSEIVKRVSLAMFIFSGVFAFIAFSTGEGAEEIAEELKRSHDLIHEHEEAAETFALLSYVLAIFSIVAFWFNWKKHPFKDLSMYIVLLISIAVIYLSYPAGQTGGEITHPEVSNDFKVPAGEHEDKEHD
jgi:uncharacterized membrane protein